MNINSLTISGREEDFKDGVSIFRWNGHGETSYRGQGLVDHLSVEDDDAIVA